jgi:flagellar hook assembly protein FlgD
MSVGTEPVIENVLIYPNPFSEATSIGFSIGSKANIKASIFTLAGRLVWTCDAQNQEGDDYKTIIYNGQDNQNNVISNGTYIYRIVAENDGKKYTKVGKITKIK